MTASGLYVTGTDTGVGKTSASVTLLHAWRAQGLRAVGMKPVASGCERSTAGWRNNDALLLQAASEPRPDYADINPFALPDATAPQLAALAAGIAIDLKSMVDAHARLSAMADAVVVEGVGGWMSPLADGIEQSDLVRALDVPVVLVIGLRLGCLSHARLTVRAIEADRCRCVGWVASRIDADFSDGDAYVELLSEALPVPCMGVLPNMQPPDPRQMAAYLQLPAGVPPLQERLIAASP